MPIQQKILSNSETKTTILSLPPVSLILMFKRRTKSPLILSVRDLSLVPQKLVFPPDLPKYLLFNFKADPFESDPFTSAINPQVRSESPTPALPPKKNKAPPPRPAPPKHSSKTPLRAAPAPPTHSSSGDVFKSDPFGTLQTPFEQSSDSKDAFGSSTGFANFANFDKV